MNEVVLTRKGQTTIPVEIRRKYGLKEGSRLLIKETEEGILLIPLPSIVDFAGTGSGADVKSLKNALDKMRGEDV